MRNAVLVHGKPLRERYENPDLPKPQNSYWFPWLKEKLQAQGVETFIPSFPQPYYPVYSAWREQFDGQCSVDNHTGLVGHSAGTDFILRLLSEEPNITPERVVLVAPWHDDRRNYGDFSSYTLDASIGERIGRLTVFVSSDDRDWIQKYAEHVKDTIPQANLVRFQDFGHFMLGNNMQTNEFPELLDELNYPI